MPIRKKSKSKRVSLWEAINWIAYDDFDRPTPPERKREIITAQWQLYEALRDGALGAQARVTISNIQGAEGQSVTLPPEFWIDYNRVQWHDSIAGSLVSDYDRVTVDRVAVLKVWPAEGKAPNRVGKRPVFDELEFLRLCVFEAASSSGGLPRFQTRFCERMMAVMDMAWGENKTPEITWYKEAVRRIYSHRKSYEQIQKALAG